MAVTEWRDRAQCLGMDMQPDRADAAEVAALQQVCEGCPVRLECRELALDQASAYGVHDGEWWGEEPHAPNVIPCEWCAKPVDLGDSGRRTRRFCGGACRLAAHRAREASGQDPLPFDLSA